MTRAGYVVYSASQRRAPTRLVTVLVELSTESADPIWEDQLWSSDNLDLTSSQFAGAIELQRLDGSELIWSELPA